MNRRQIWLFSFFTALALLLAMFLSYRDRAAGQIVPEATPAPSPTPIITPAPTAAPTPTSAPKKYRGAFELPIEGATGYATIALNLRSDASAASEKIGSLAPGDGFRILGEEGDFWRITDGDKTGYVAHRYCMINLPDVIPSIVYDNTNAYNSKILSSGKPLPGVTGQGLYTNSAYNPRFGRDEFIMPALYEMAKKIHIAQQAALADGNSLKIYEAYRPHAAQRKVVNAMAKLAGQDAQVNAGISTPPWKVSWFVSQGTSHHQRGCAIDVSLVKVDRIEERRCGPYAYDEVVEFTEYEMPTPIHELSIAAAAFSQPINSSSQTAWRSAEPAAGMNRNAHLLQRYCTDAGLTPLASEWWHFNDLKAYARVRENAGVGEFVLEKVYSVE